ncbi:MAG: 50S ribosomal protein L13 [Candidatus Sungbacteria bacterium]|uniref:Large ribosomal subunit protein uL13 n=1 Tax=Candidatus Sungiibacteriota bacterium TaxID=2750080 RepID=A0A932DSA0_9BACT|nr:50S ribosomal protein L13 [Candidatus Sungbacteria bacterium]MBI2465842.1 50S ribosomal protein L13 [Candidatus Sungbacteria bacterium]
MTNSKLQTKEYKFDADGEILGRLATRVAVALRGKDGADFSPNNPDLSRKVVVFNTDKLKFTGNKLADKKYFKYSGYPGGISQRTLKEYMVKDSRGVLREAVYGMLPKNRLRDKFIGNLRLYKGEIR